MEKLRQNVAALCVMAALTLAILAACGGPVGVSGHAITVEPEDNWVVSGCPERAAAGETVVVQVVDTTDAFTYVAVNGDTEFGTFTRDGYEFVMPDEDVTITAWVVSNGLA